MGVGVVLVEGGLVGGGQQVGYGIGAGVVLETRNQFCSCAGLGLGDGGRDDVGVVGEVLGGCFGDVADLGAFGAEVGVQTNDCHAGEQADGQHRDEYRDPHSTDSNGPA
mgnify:CR=1 FL=1